MPTSLPNTVAVAFAGESGTGVVEAARALARIAARLSLDVLGEVSLPPTFQDGVASVRLRLGFESPLSTGGSIDALFALDAAGYRSLRDSLRRAAVAFVEEDTAAEFADSPRTHEILPTPLRRLARDTTGSERSEAWIAVGMACGLVGCPIDAVERLAAEAVTGSERDRSDAVRAIRAGLRHALDRFAAKKLRLGEGFRERDAQTSTGARAIARGLRAAGVRFAAGFPEAEALDVWREVVASSAEGAGERTTTWRAESAAAAGAAALGASFGGHASAIVTSSSGLAALGEILATASASELPLVVVVVQRAGVIASAPPAVEQGDLLAAIHGGPLQSPRVVLAPSDVASAAEIAHEAVRIAEEHQIPTILLADGALARAIGSLAMQDGAGALPPVARRTPVALAERFRRYEPVPVGVSPIPSPGMAGMGYLATGADHDPLGHPIGPGAAREAAMQRRARRLEAIRLELERRPLLAAAAAEVELEEYDAVAIGWGSTRGAIAEGVALAAREGLRVLALHPRVLHPLPHAYFERVRERFDDRHVLVLEQNGAGDLARHLRGELALRSTSHRRVDGLPLRPADVLARIREACTR